MKKETIKQFETVIAYLKELPDELFNYSYYGAGCGTVGCVVGHYDQIFPKFWKFDESGDPVMIEGNDLKTTSSELLKFHNIPIKDVLALFYGDLFYQVKLNLPVTSCDSSKEKVIKLFEAYTESIK